LIKIAFFHRIDILKILVSLLVKKTNLYIAIYFRAVATFEATEAAASVVFRTVASLKFSD